MSEYQRLWRKDVARRCATGLFAGAVTAGLLATWLWSAQWLITAGILLLAALITFCAAVT